ncbi:SDR family oxidoreductase [Deinococcus sp. Arct2-2]|uniref:SDR family oxidoreductase n=1 Tax=Deinococcus sp. Arct2-2 TaxID=2568653 RepID=UPI0023EF4F94|nr:SDR family oxidoreductase [Deinococcus sp. Arct2-2]
MTAQKTVLITGATNGIGKVAALELARQGFRVLITSRDEAKGRQVLGELQARSRDAAPELFVGDLSSMADVRRVALEVTAAHPRLDVLINNAGGLFDRRLLTADGFEYTFAFNHLTYFLLSNLLRPSLNAAGSARIVSVSSSGNNLARMRWDDLQYQSGYSGWLAYGQSKLMNVLFAFALARRLQGTGVTSNVLHPGVINSGFGKTTTGLNRLVSWAANLTAISAEQGARTSLYLATSPAVNGVSGQYFFRQKVARANPLAYDQFAQERLWVLSERLLAPWLEPVGTLGSAPDSARLGPTTGEQGHRS